MPQRLFLHVGTGKTGSSALQYAFLHARKTLAEHGIRYPEGPETRVAKGVFPGGNANALRQAFRAMDAEGAIKAVKALLRDEQDILLSNEGLYATRKEDLATFNQALRSLGWTASVLVFFRPQVDMLASAYLQRLKANKHRTDVNENDYAMMQYQAEHYDWLACAEKLETVFGADNLRVRWYPSVLRGEGVLAAAFNWLGVPPPQIENPQVNPTPGREAAFVLKQANAAGIGNRRFADHFVKRAQEAGLLGSKVTLGPEVHRHIDSSMRSSNAELLRRYCPELSPENDLQPEPASEPRPLDERGVAQLKTIAATIAENMGASAMKIRAAFE